MYYRLNSLSCPRTLQLLRRSYCVGKCVSRWIRASCTVRFLWLRDLIRNTSCGAEPSGSWLLSVNVAWMGQVDERDENRVKFSWYSPIGFTMEFTRQADAFTSVLFILSPGATQPIVGVYFTALYRALASSRTRLLDQTQRRATVGRTPLNEWSVRRRDPYLTTHNTHNRQTTMPPVGFEPTITEPAEAVRCLN